MVAAVMAVYGVWTRLQVRPVARPRDKAGRPLVIRGHFAALQAPDLLMGDIRAFFAEIR
jgi:hypothetical protein